LKISIKIEWYGIRIVSIVVLYLDYVQRKMDAESEKWWNENNMTNEKLEEILNTHLRTPY